MAQSAKGRMGILVGGGPAPGINAVIAAATIEAIHNGLEVVGIYDGFKWLIKTELSSSAEEIRGFLAPHTRILTIGDVSQARVRGGSILHTSRANPTENPEDMEKTVKGLLDGLGLRYLVTIGGDDTAYAASETCRASNAREKGRLRVAHVPKTIDNNLPLPAGMPTFGFQTARTVGAELVRNLVEDARTTRRWYVAVLMGADAGHLPLGAGNVAGATLTIIPEEFADGHVTMPLLCEIIEGAVFKGRAVGHDYGVAVVAEGLSEMLPKDYREDQLPALVGTSPYGKLRLADVPLGLMLKRELTRREKERADQRKNEGYEEMAFVDVTIGYELRCADPIPFDAEYCQELGWGAVRYLLGIGEESWGEQGAMISIQAAEVVPIPFSEILDSQTRKCAVRHLNIHSNQYRAARANMIRLERTDFEDAAQLGRIAAAAKATAEQFRQTYAHVAGL